MDPTDINVKIEEVPLMIPKFNHAAKGKLAKTHAKNMASSKGKPSGEIRVGNAKLPQKKQIASKGMVSVNYLYTLKCLRSLRDTQKKFIPPVIVEVDL